MKRALVHAVLLVVMLVIAFVTWTRGDRVAASDRVTLWEDDPNDITEVTYRAPTRTVHIERRGQGKDSYLWAQQTDSIQPPPVDSGAPPPAKQAQTAEFPLGDAGITAVETLARLNAVRDLGAASAQKRTTYGFADTMPVLTLKLRNGKERALALGTAVVGGVSRYVQDVERKKIYVVEASAFRPFELTGDMLRLTKMQSFEPQEIARATVRAGAVERTMQRRAPNAYTRPAWTAPGSDRADEAFATFMELVDQLWAIRFVPNASADTLQRILRVDYLETDGDTLGFVELFRTRGNDSAPVYLMRTRRTVVLAEVNPAIAARVEEDVTTLFGSKARSVSLRPRAPLHRHG
jgi:hypothetical protein